VAVEEIKSTRQSTRVACSTGHHPSEFDDKNGALDGLAQHFGFIDQDSLEYRIQT
jgi:hypothetical protein